MTEQQLRAAGALPDTCTERIARVCLMCGTAAAHLEEWKGHGDRCGICANDTYRDECSRCRGACPAVATGTKHPCASLTVYRSTRRVAFPERVPEPKKKTPEPRPTQKTTPETKTKPLPKPEDLSWLRVFFSGLWARYWKNFGKYAVIQGRSNRFDLLSFLVGQLVGFAVMSAMKGAPFFLFATIIPTWALAVRRLHDSNLSGKWLWLLLFWPIALVVLPIMLLRPSTKGLNRYGPVAD